MVKKKLDVLITKQNQKKNVYITEFNQFLSSVYALPLIYHNDIAMS